jgi:RNA polymerase sigma-70 factor (ECF subfamily)
MTDLGSLYRTHAADVFRFALHLCGSRAEAEDLTSETFVRAWTSPEAIRATTVKGYLFTIARNLYLQGRRRARRHVELGEDVRDPGPDPTARAEHASEVEAVLADLGSLGEVDRAALLMKAVEGMPYEDVARALGITVGAAKVKVHRARRELLRRRQGE